MGISFSRAESLQGGFRRVVGAWIDGALDAARGAAEADRSPAAYDDAVHDIRTGIKKLRALLRLMRPLIGDSKFRRANRELRDLARNLSGARDAAVALNLLERLLRDSGSDHADHAGRGELTAAASLATTPIEAPTNMPAARDLPALMMPLASLRRRLCRLALESAGWGDVAMSYANAYRAARRQGRRAMRLQTSESFHDWRKRTKDLWYQARLLRKRLPSVVTVDVKRVKRLTVLLGDVHDLDMLSAVLYDQAARPSQQHPHPQQQERTQAQPKLQMHKPNRQTRKLIDRRRRRLHKAIRKQALLVFEDKPTLVRRRASRVADD